MAVFYLLIPESYILCNRDKVATSALAVRYGLLNRRIIKCLFEDNVDVNGEREKEKKEKLNTFLEGWVGRSTKQQISYSNELH